MIWILGALNGVLLIYIALLRFEVKEKSSMLKETNKESWDKNDKILELQRERSQLLENINELREEKRDLIKENDEYKNTNKVLSDNNVIIKKSRDFNREWFGKSLRKVRKMYDVLAKRDEIIRELREQLKLEDEASCRIIKDLEDEIEKERALNQTYSGYVKYILNAPRAVRRRFVNGECIDWYDENGVLRMKIKEEK